MRKAPPAPLKDAASVGQWELLARPDFLFLLATFTAALDEVQGECPKVERDGAFTIVRGDCVDASGTTHTGYARVSIDDDEIRVRLKNFGEADGVDAGSVSGRVRVWVGDEPRFSMDLLLRSDEPMDDLAPGSTWLAIKAEGSRNARQEWSMQGELAAEKLGRVKAKASGIDSDRERCKHEPLTGQTELWSGGHHVEIRYDGASDCDEPGTAKWWRDGVEQGELRGISGGLDCSVSGQRGRARFGVVALLLLGVGRCRRRRVKCSQYRSRFGAHGADRAKGIRSAKSSADPPLWNSRQISNELTTSSPTNSRSGSV